MGDLMIALRKQWLLGELEELESELYDLQNSFDEEEKFDALLELNNFEFKYNKRIAELQELRGFDFDFEIVPVRFWEDYVYEKMNSINLPKALWVDWEATFELSAGQYAKVDYDAEKWLLIPDSMRVERWK